MTEEPTGDVLVFQRDDGTPALEVRLDNETVWLTQAQLVELFQTSKANISEHIANVLEEGELTKATTVREFRTVRQEGSRTVRRSLTYYNLDLIISVGYRVKSGVATQFRIWATERLRDYLVKGYAINEQRLNELGQIVTVLARSSDELVSGVAENTTADFPNHGFIDDQGAPRSAPGTLAA